MRKKEKTMKYLITFLSALLLCGGGAAASPIIIPPSAHKGGLITPPTQNDRFADYDFNQDRMIVSTTRIYIISSFETADHISAYTYDGRLVWEAPFFAKVISWQMHADAIFVFSKDRGGYQTYLTCLDRYTGTMKWQRP
jgi:hypothetical protein